MAIWEFIVDGAVRSLSDRAPYDVVSATGVGLAPVRRLTQRGPLQHGETDLGFRLDSRTITLVLIAVGETEAEVDAMRDDLTILFGPRRDSPAALRVTRDDGAVRQIDCRAFGLTDFPVTPDDSYGPWQKMGVQLAAADPAWYEPEFRRISFTASSFAYGIALPLAVPLIFPASLSGSATFREAYGGSFDAFPTITVTGPITDALITNGITGETLSFAGYTVASGTTLTIDLAYGKKTVIDSNGANQISKLAAGSSLATWRILSRLEAPGGINPITISGSGLTVASQVLLEYRNRFLSL